MGSAAARVLVVDDVEDLGETAVAILALAGHAAIAVACAEEALSTLSRDPPPDPLFSDIVMGRGISGGALAEAAQRLRPDLQVVLTSAYLDLPTRRWIFIPKPWQPRDFGSIAGLILSRNWAASS